MTLQYELIRVDDSVPYVMNEGSLTAFIQLHDNELVCLTTAVLLEKRCRYSCRVHLFKNLLDNVDFVGKSLNRDDQDQPMPINNDRSLPRHTRLDDA